MSIRKMLILLFLILSVHCVFAQDTIVRKRFVEYYVGGNRSDVSKSYGFKNNYVNPKFGANAGLFYGRNISKNVSIGTGLCFDQFRYKTKQFRNALNPIDPRYTPPANYFYIYNFSYNYNRISYPFVSIPLYLKFDQHVNNKLYFGIKLGFLFYSCPFYFVKQTYTTSEGSGINRFINFGFWRKYSEDYVPGQAAKTNYVGSIKRQLIGYFTSFDLNYKISEKYKLTFNSTAKTFDIIPFYFDHKKYQMSFTLGISKNLGRPFVRVKPIRKNTEGNKKVLNYDFGNPNTKYNIGSNNISIEPFGFTILGIQYERLETAAIGYWVCIHAGVGFSNKFGLMSSLGVSMLNGEGRSKVELGLVFTHLAKINGVQGGVSIGGRTFLKNGFNIKYYFAPTLRYDYKTDLVFLPGFSIGKLF